MKNLALRWQISLVGAIPMIAFLAFSGWKLHSNFKAYIESNILEKRIHLAFVASALADESQKWREYSGSFLKGQTSLEKQQGQYERVVSEIQKVRKVLPDSGFEDVYQREISSLLDEYSSMQRAIESKQISESQQLAQTSKKISRLLRVTTDVADQTALAKVSSEMRSLAIIEEAKNAGSQLRAEMTAILSLNKPVSGKQAKHLLDLKAVVNASLNSQGLVLTQEGQDIVDKFFSSKNWATVTDTAQVIVEKSQEGGYYRDPDVFHGVISTALGSMKDLILYKEAKLDKSVVKERTAATVTLITLSVVTLLLIGFLIFFNLYSVRNITGRLKDISHRLSEGSKEVSNAASQISESSTRLSEASVEQASSLQETVSSADEINAMVNKNAQSAKQSKEMSEESEKKVLRAQDTVGTMLGAIEKISASNDNVVSQMNQGNQKISEIVKIIRNIGEKTDIINDIVFQTKLLSFNASVEAARAGEHGKGFAVVAEEVGNLASMSGNAANEISEMLNESIKQVEGIVETTKSQVGDMTAASSRAMEDGKKVAEDCKKSLEEILGASFFSESNC